MYALKLLEEAGSDTGSVWIPVVVLGWFLLMTIVGWQVSRRDTAVENTQQDMVSPHPESNPSEFDNH